MVALGRDGFLAIAPPFTGDILWEHLEILQKGEFLVIFFIPLFDFNLHPPFSECESSSDAISSAGAYDSNSRSDVSDYLSDQKLPNANNNNNSVGQFPGKYNYPPHHLNGKSFFIHSISACLFQLILTLLSTRRCRRRFN